MDTNGLFKKVVNLVTMASFLLWNLAAAVPEGGSVAQGSAQISQAGAQTTINQTSQNTVINWHGFDTAATESVKFNQPNSSSIALNRINSGQPTNFNGSLSANGQVWLLNPSGVLFGSTSKIDVAGLLVTTHNITDSNFMSGNYIFTLDPASLNSKIINNGLISVLDSGIVALVAPGVENNGIITANLGKVYLSSGATFVLDMYGDELINFGSNAPIDKGSVSNAGQIIANGGKVHMTANYAAGVLDNMISMTGSIQAKTVGTNSKGQIVLYGGNKKTNTVTGVTYVKGKLDTSDSTGGNNGGIIETSGGYVYIDPTTILNAGAGGQWILDPFNVTIVGGGGITNASTCTGTGNSCGVVPPPVFLTTSFNLTNDSMIGADYIAGQLNAGTSVFIQTNNNGGGSTGNITVTSGITQMTPVSVNVELRLSANNTISINAPINFSGGASFVTQSENTASGPQQKTVISADISTGGSQQYSQDVYLSPTSGNLITLTSTNSYIAFYKKLNSDALGTARDLTVSAVNGSVSFGITSNSNGDLVGSIFPLQTLTTNGFTVAFSNATAIHTVGAQTYNNAFGFLGPTSVDFFGSTVNFNGGIIAAPNPNNGNVLVATNATVHGDAVIGGGPLGDTTGGHGPLGAVIVTGNTTLNGVTGSATASQDYKGAVTINSSTTNNLNATGLIHFENFIDGQGSLITNSNIIEFDAGVGSNNFPNNVLNVLDVTASQIYLYTGFQILTNGDQIYRGPVVFNTLFARSFGAGVTFKNTVNAQVDGADDLTVVASVGTIEFDGTVGGGNISVPGSGTPGAFTLFSNAVTLNGLNVPGFSITASFSQRYTGPITLAGDVTLTTNVQNFTFVNAATTINGGFNLTVNAAQTAIYNGDIGAITPLASFTESTGTGDAFFAGSIVKTVGSQTYNGGPVLLQTTPFTFESTSGLPCVDGVGNCITFNSALANLVGGNPSDPTTHVDITVKGNLVVGPSGDLDINIFFGQDYGFINSLTVMGSTFIDGSSGGGVGVGTQGDQTYTGPVILASGPGAVFTNYFATHVGGGKILFKSTIDNCAVNGTTCLVSTPRTLNIYLGFFPAVLSSTVEFDDSVGANIATGSLDSLTIFNFIAAASAVNMNTNNIAGFKINTVNNQTYNNANVVIGGDTALNSTSGSITFGGAIDGGFGLNAHAAAGAVAFDGIVGTTPLSTLDVTGTADINTTAITTTGTQTYHNAVLLNNTNPVTFAGLLMTFLAPVESTGTPARINILGDLTLPSTSSIGATSDVSNLSVSGTTHLGTTITTTGDPSFGPIILTADSAITDGSVGGITFTSTIDSDAFGPWSLTVNASAGPVEFDGIIGTGNVGKTLVNNLDVTGTLININTAQISTSGIQTYNGPVEISALSSLLSSTGSDITFNSTIDGPGALSITTPGNINFFDVIGNGNPLSSLATTSGPGLFTFTSFIFSNVAPSFIITTGDQTYTGSVEVQLTNPAITFQGNQIEIKNLLIASSISDVTIKGNLLMDLNSNVGGGGATPWSINLRSFTVTGSSIIGGEIRTSTGDETFMGPVQLNGSTLFGTQLSGDIIFQSTIEGPGSAYISALGSVYFNDTIGFLSSLGSLTAFGTNVDIKNSSNTTSISALGFIDIQASGGAILLDTLNSITFNASQVDFSGPMDSYSATTPLQTDIVINGNLFYIEGVNGTPSGIGLNYTLPNYTSVNSLDVKGTSQMGANVGGIPQDFNIRTLNDQTYEQGVTLGGSNQNFTSANGKITFQSTFNGNIDTQSFTAVAAGVVEFDGGVGNLNLDLINLDVTGSQIIVNTSQVKTAGYQDYHSPVLMTSVGAITFTGTNIIFEAPVESSGTPAQMTITGNLVVGNSSSIGAASDVSSLTVSGTTRDGGNITTTNDPVFVGAYFLTNNVTITDLSVVGITFGSTVDNDAVFTGPWNLTLNVSAGTVSFGDDVGTLNGALQSLTVNGTSSFSKGSLQTVNTHGSQIYTNTVTLNNDTQLFTSDPGPLGANIVSFGAGAAGLSGPLYNLTVVTNNPANGPTGAGITGTVDVAGLTLGGAGGANLSQNYPVTESFVAGQGGQQARTNTVSPADVVGVVIYCVNGFNCAPAPGPTPTPTPIDNIPPTQVFNPPVFNFCAAGGCGTLEVVIDNLEEAGIVSCGGGQCAYGFVEAKDTNGNSRILMPGDVVYAGDRISKNSESCMCIKSIYSKKKTCMGPGKTKAVYDK
jgi:filamentous hemagglutinin family protein